MTNQNQMVRDLLKWWQKSNPDFHETIIDSENGQTLLHLASEVGYFEIVEELISMGADTNIQDFESYTPLHNCRDTDTMRILLENGANVNHRCDGNSTPLHKALWSPKIVSLLLDYGPDLNIQEEMFGTPIHQALLFESNTMPKKLVENVVTLMLEKGRNIDFNLECDGETILEVAKNKGFEKIVRIILKKMCPNPKISDSIYPLKMLL